MKKIYFCYTNYFATGEGVTTRISLQVAEDEAEASQKHWDHEYFSQGTQTFELNKENVVKIKEKLILEGFSKEAIDFFCPKGKKPFYGFGDDFKFEMHCNRS